MTVNDKPRFAQAMAGLAVALREKDPDAVQMRIYFKALEGLGVETVEAAAERLIAQAQWFPKPAEWKAVARTIESERAMAQAAVIQKLRLRGQSLCLACGDTGFVQTEIAFKRCDCRTLRRMEIQGTRPLPELPEAPEADRLAIDIGAVTQALASTKGMR